MAVNPATNTIYVAGSNKATVIDGATNATTTVAAGTDPDSLAVNPTTNRVYLLNYDSNDVTVLTEKAASAVPLTTTIAPLAGNVTDSQTPTFTLSATSTFAPTAPPVRGIFTQVDTWQGPWQAATPSGGVFTATTPVLQGGTHVLYAFAVDGQDGAGCSNGNRSTCSPLVGSMAAYVFTIIPKADVSITKTDGVTSEVPGTAAIYTLVASNAGPSAAPSVTVSDVFPANCPGAEMDLHGCGWRVVCGVGLRQRQRHGEPPGGRFRDVHGHVHHLGRRNGHPEQYGHGDSRRGHVRPEPGERYGHGYGHAGFHARLRAHGDSGRRRSRDRDLLTLGHRVWQRLQRDL